MDGHTTKAWPIRALPKAFSEAVEIEALCLFTWLHAEGGQYKLRAKLAIMENMLEKSVKMKPTQRNSNQYTEKK